ncbi:potassium channel family protein [Pseudonocardia sp.]|jgi:hypothetical protein|uniref:potassium channel family protein n=1 Tax=Pseudonocardia sp. TaxID=60912 RepID=UPI003D10B52C
MDVERTRALNRRLLVVAGVRSVVTAALLLLVYYRAPLDGRLDAEVLVWLGIGLCGLVLALTWQVRMIMASDTPRLRAAETVAVGLPILLVLYASTYAVLSQDVPASFSQPLDRTGALYYTMTVFTTVGFGDIAPTSALTRILTMTQMVVGLLAVGVVAKLLLGAVDVAVRRRSGTGTDR